MEKITHVKVENFRNIKSMEFDVSKSLVISGENGIGKSNLLNSIVYAITDSVYTDKSGVGENDISSIVPKDLKKGEHTAVELTFTSGATFRKEYITGYDRVTGKVNKHTTKGYINGVESKNMEEWRNKLYEVLDFVPAFKNFKEVNIFVDPLYALQKMDSKDLREFLAACGCTVTNEELYASGFEDLRKFEKKYLGDFGVMRQDLKKQVKSINEDIRRIDTLVSQFNDIQPFEEERLNVADKKVEELYSKKASIKVGGNDVAVQTKELELKELKTRVQANLDKERNELNLKISELESQKRLEDSKLQNERASKTLDLDSQVQKVKNEISKRESIISSNNNTLNSMRTNLTSVQEAGKSCQAKKSDMQQRLLEAETRKYDGYVTCPSCGETFPISEDSLAKFNELKAKDITFYAEQINSFNKSIADYSNEANDIITKSKDIKVVNERNQTEISEFKSKLQELETKLTQIVSEPLTNPNFEKVESDIANLRSKLAAIPCMEDNEEIKAKELELSNLKSNDSQAVSEELAKVNEEISKAESEREDLYIERSNWNQKQEHQKKLDTAIAELNNTETLLGRVEDFIHTMINKINQKAKEITGMDFVMLEENLVNDGVKEVCYAVVDGVPFANINTAEKYIRGIRFIEKIKDIVTTRFNLPRNSLPILADKFEGIDHIERIKSLTNEQLICTRVGIEKDITFLGD